MSSTMEFAFALHGGAGAVAGRDYRETEAHLAELSQACRERLESGTTSLDVVEYALDFSNQGVRGVVFQTHRFRHAPQL